MESNLILTQIPIEELSAAISNLVKADLKEFIIAIASPKEETVYLNRKEVCKILGVSLPTLDKYTTTGILPAYRMGRKVRFKKNEVQQVLTKIQTV